MGEQVGYPIKSLISFDALEKPKWRPQEACSQGIMTVEEMISDIMKYHKRWKEEEGEYDKQLIEEVKDKFLLEFITHVNKEEEHGFSTLEETTSALRNRSSHSRLNRSQSIEEKETINVEKAYINLLEKLKAKKGQVIMDCWRLVCWKKLIELFCKIFRSHQRIIQDQEK